MPPPAPKEGEEGGASEGSNQVPELDDDQDQDNNKDGDGGYLPRMMSQASVLAAVSGPSDASALEALARDEELAQAKALAEAEAALEKASLAESAAAAAEAAAEQQLVAMKVLTFYS